MLRQRSQSEKRIEVHNWEHKIDLLFKQLEAELSESNFELIKKYDREMVGEGIKKPSKIPLKCLDIQ